MWYLIVDYIRRRIKNKSLSLIWGVFWETSLLKYLTIYKLVLWNYNVYIVTYNRISTNSFCILYNINLYKLYRYIIVQSNNKLLYANNLRLDSNLTPPLSENWFQLWTCISENGDLQWTYRSHSIIAVKLRSCYQLSDG